MRFSFLSAFVPLLVPASGCTSDRAALQCEAATSYLSNELANLDDKEFVYGSSDDKTTFDASWVEAADRSKAVSDFSKQPWLDSNGTSAWHSKEVGRVAKTPEEIRLVRQLFTTPSSVNAVPQCSEITALLRDRNIAYGEDAIKTASANNNPELKEHSKTIANIYLPVLSDDGRSAVLFVSRSWAPLAGEGLIIKIERQDNGKWLPTRTQQIWVS